jgi:predicted CopG family antitoxin
MKPKRTTTISLDDETYRVIKIRAEREGRSMSSFINYYIKKLMEKEKPVLHKSVG